MNKVYKLIWSVVQNCWVVVSEIGKGKKKKSKAFGVTVLSAGFLFTSTISFALSPNCNSSTFVCELNNNFNPQGNNQNSGNAIVDDGNSYNLQGLSGSIYEAPSYIYTPGLSDLVSNNHIVDPSFVLPPNDAFNVRYVTNKNITVVDPATGFSRTFSVYDSAGIRNTPLGNNVYTAVRSPDQNPIYYNANLAKVNNGEVNVNIANGNLKFGAVKESKFIEVDGTVNNAKAIWSSSNFISLTDAAMYGRDEKKNISITYDVYAGNIYDYKGDIRSITNIDDHKNYNDWLISEIQSGDLDTNLYLSELSKVYSTINASADYYYIPRKSDGITPVDGWEVVEAPSKVYFIYAKGENASANVASGAVVHQALNGGNYFIRVEDGAVGVNEGQIISDYGNAISIGAGSKFVNKSELDFSMNAWLANSNVMVESGGEFVNDVDAIYNISNRANYRPDGVLSNGDVKNKGVMNVGAVYFSRSGYGAVGVNSYSGTVVNDVTGVINLSQTKDGKAIRNADGLAGIMLNAEYVDDRVSGINYGEINFSEAAEGAIGVRIQNNARFVNEVGGSINMYANGVDSDGNSFLPAVNYGVTVSGNAKTIFENKGDINVFGSNNIGVNAFNGGVANISGGVLSVNGSVNSQGLTNYGAVAGRDGASPGTVDFSGGKVNLTGDNAIGIVARNGGTVRLSGDGEILFSSGLKQIGYLINGSNSKFINTGSAVLDVKTDKSTLIRLDNGATFSASGQAIYKASGTDSVAILASGAGTSINAADITLISSGQNSTAVKVEGGAAGTLASSSNIQLTGVGAIAAIVDGMGTNILGDSTGIQSNTSLTSAATLNTDLDDVVGYIAKNQATLINSGNIELAGDNATAIKVLDGSTGTNSGQIVLNGAGSLGLYAQSNNTSLGVTSLNNTGGIILNGDWDGSSDASRSTGIFASGENVSVTIGNTVAGAQTSIELNGDGAVGVKAESGSQVVLKNNTELKFSDNATNQIGFWIDGAGSKLNSESTDALVANASGATIFNVTGGGQLVDDLKMDLNLSGSGSANQATIGIAVSGAGSRVELGKNSQIRLGDNTEGIYVSDGASALNQADFILNNKNGIVGHVNNATLENTGTVTSVGGTENITAFLVEDKGTFTNDGNIDLSAGQSHTAVSVFGSTVINNSLLVKANGTAIDIHGASSVLKNNGTIEAVDGVAAVRLSAGASLDFESVGNSELKANGAADGILLEADAGNLGVANTTINMGGASTGIAINNKAGSEVRLDGTTINAQQSGSGIVMNGGAIVADSNSSLSKINVTNGTGILYQGPGGGEIDGDISASGNIQVNVAGQGTGIKAALTGADRLANLDIDVNVTTANGGHAADISGASVVKNSGDLKSVSTSHAVLNVHDATQIENSGIIEGAGVTASVVQMSSAKDITFKNSGNGEITGLLDFGEGNNTLIATDNSKHTGVARFSGNGAQNIQVDAGASLDAVQVGGGSNTALIKGNISSYLASDGSQNTVTVAGAGASFGSLDSGKGSNNVLNLDDFSYTVDGTTQNAIKHFDNVNLKNSAVLTLQQALKLTASESETQGVFNIDASSELVLDGLSTHAQALTGTGTVSVTDQSAQFDFQPSVGMAFAGKVQMNADQFALSGSNTEALSQATLIVQANNATTVGDGEQAIGGLTFEQGKLVFDVDVVGSEDYYVKGLVKVQDLDVSAEGTVQLNYPAGAKIVDTDNVQTLPLLDQQNQLSVQLIKAKNIVGTEGDIQFVDEANNVISNYQQLSIVEGGDEVAIGDYDFNAGLGANDGLYFKYGLKKIDLQPGKALIVDTALSDENKLFAQVTGSGDLTIRAADGAGKDLIISNATNDYTGKTIIETGKVTLGDSHALGDTKALEMAADTQLAIAGYAQTVGDLNTVADSAIDLQAGHLTVTGAGVVNGALMGAGAVTLDGATSTNPLVITADNAALNAQVTVNAQRELVLQHINALGTSRLALTDGKATLDGVSGTFESSITGAGTVGLVGGSEVTLGQVSPDFAGDFDIDDGHLTANGPEYLGKAAVDVAAAGQLTLDYAQNTDWVLQNAITGDGTLQKKGTGNVVLRDALEIGQVNIDEGRFLVADDLSSAVAANLKASQVNVAAAAALGGYGTVTADVRNSGSILVGSASANQVTPAFGSFTVKGNYHGDKGKVVINAELGDDNSPSDKLIITGAATGKTEVQVQNLGGAGASTSNGIRIIETGSSENSQTFTLQGNYVTAGQYDYSLNLHDNEATGDNWYLESKIKSVNPPYVPPTEPPVQPPVEPPVQPPVEPPVVVPPVEPPVQPPVEPPVVAPPQQKEETPVYSPDMGSYLGIQLAGNTLFTTRLEDREGASGYEKSMEGSKSNVWVRTFSSHNRYDAMSGQLKSSGNSFVNQIGIGLGSLGEQSRTNFGVMGGIGRYSGDTRSRLTNRKSSATAEGYSLGAYLTWYENPAEKRGAYVDSWMLWNHFSNKVDSVSGQRYKYDSSGITASVEAGIDILLNENGKKKWWLQPQAQVIYQGVSADTFKDSQGVRIESESGNVQVRLGLKTYLEIPTQVGAFTNYRPYLALNYIHNSDPYEVRVKGDKYGIDGTSNIKELKFGIEGHVTKNSQLWMNASYLKGNGGYKSYQGNIGWKYNF